MKKRSCFTCKKYPKVVLWIIKIWGKAAVLCYFVKSKNLHTKRAMQFWIFGMKRDGGRKAVDKKNNAVFLCSSYLCAYDKIEYRYANTHLIGNIKEKLYKCLIFICISRKERSAYCRGGFVFSNNTENMMLNRTLYGLIFQKATKRRFFCDEIVTKKRYKVRCIVFRY